MLAKEGWRLLHQIDTLAYRLLKAKYFRSGTFMEARHGHRPSLTRNSIWRARGTLEKGCIWRVGNGNSIRIWFDNWIQNEANLKACSPHWNNVKDSLVSCLIDEETKQWRAYMIDRMLDHNEATTIKSIPISKSGKDGMLVWHYKKNGIYTVKRMVSFTMIPESQHLQRYSRGETIGVYVKSKEWVRGPFIFKAMAAVSALDFAKSMGFQKMEVKGDALTTIKKLKSDFSGISDIIEEGKQIAATFTQCILTHTKRSCNAVAHLSAKQSLWAQEEEVWVEDTTNFIQANIINDVLVL
ncbi:hypothetical protein DITRI_Ditri09bG0077200 [Diplodiscus trichospermus]